MRWSGLKPVLRNLGKLAIDGCAGTISVGEQQMLKMIFALAEEVALMRTQIAELKKKVAGGPGS